MSKCIICNKEINSPQDDYPETWKDVCPECRKKILAELLSL